MTASMRNGNSTGIAQLAQHRDHEGEEQDQHLGDEEHLDVQDEALADREETEARVAEEGLLHLLRVEERVPHGGRPGREHEQGDDGTDEHDGARSRDHGRALSPEQVRAPVVAPKLPGGGAPERSSVCWSARRPRAPPLGHRFALVATATA